jgi:hypothetical protein
LPLRVVAGNTAPNHFVAPFVAYDERDEIAAAKAKAAKSDHDDELQQLITHRQIFAGLCWCLR